MVVQVTIGRQAAGLTSDHRTNGFSIRTPVVNPPVLHVLTQQHAATTCASGADDQRVPERKRVQLVHIDRRQAFTGPAPLVARAPGTTERSGKLLVRTCLLQLALGGG